jgi:hypothetical protein
MSSISKMQFGGILQHISMHFRTPSRISREGVQARLDGTEIYAKDLEDCQLCLGFLKRKVILVIEDARQLNQFSLLIHLAKQKQAYRSPWPICPSQCPDRALDGSSVPWE